MNKEIKETFKRSMPIMAVTLAIGFVAMFNMICVVGVKYSSLSITKRAANYLNWMNKFAVIGNSPWFKIVYVILGIAAVVVIYRFFTSFSSDDEPSQNIVERKKKNILGIYLLFITALWGLAIYLVPPAVGHMYEIKLLELFAFSLCAGGFWIFSSAKWLGLPEGKRIDHKWAFLLGAAAVWVVAAEIYVFGKISRPLEIFLTSGVGLFQLDDIMTMVRLLMWGIFVIILHIFIVVPTIFALVPVKLKLEKRFFRILIPATIFLLVFLTSNFLRMYLKKYDYDKKDFAEATGIDINSHTHKTLIYLREDDSGRKESYMEKISLKRKIWDPFTYM
ncbi:MAG: hypothetical protein FP827_09560, partial [Candidatus Omnitrophica bacterium]|nr:hypothetical protein [Candidatus Omnitrophota bacterium]